MEEANEWDGVGWLNGTYSRTLSGSGILRTTALNGTHMLHTLDLVFSPEWTHRPPLLDCIQFFSSGFLGAAAHRLVPLISYCLTLSSLFLTVAGGFLAVNPDSTCNITAVEAVPLEQIDFEVRFSHDLVPCSARF